MESDLLEVAEYALEQPGVLGYICADKDGLCLSAQAKGKVKDSISGIAAQIADLAGKIEEAPNKSEEYPKIRVDLEHTKMIIQSRDMTTTALIFAQK